MAVRVQVTFEGDSMDEVIAEVGRWLNGQSPEAPATPESETERRQREIREVLAGIRGEASRRFVRDVAEATARGQTVSLDDLLMARYGWRTGTALAGTVSGPNKLMRRIGHRDLIVRDAAGGYRMDPADAEIVLATTT